MLKHRGSNFRVPELVARLAARSGRLLSAQHVVGLADQVVVSAGSFLSTVLIGRYTSPYDLGVYALSVSILAWLATAQETLISVPYTLGRSSEHQLASIQAGHALISTGILGGAAIAITLCSAALLAGTHDAVMSTGWALAGAAPFVIGRDFARRSSFATSRNIEALLLDAAAVGLQIALFGWLVWTSQLNSASAIWAVALACAIPILGWLWLVRDRFRFEEGVFAALGQGWLIGKWIFARQVLSGFQPQIALWFIAAVVGADGAGVFTALLSVAMLSNPLILGFGNVLWARAADAFRTHGGGRLLRETWGAAMQLSTMIGLFCAAMLVFGDSALALLYRDQAYHGYSHVLAILCLCQLCTSISLPAAVALDAMGRVRQNFALVTLEIAFQLLLGWPLVVHWGLKGAAYNLLLGSVLRVLFRWTAVLVLLRSVVGIRARSESETSVGYDVVD